MSTNDGGPFHPCEVEHIEGEVYGIQTGISRSIHTGASLRDHFAGLAMQGMIACGEEYDNAELGRFAYDVADAMLRAREAGQ